MTDAASRATLDVLAKISPCAATVDWIFDILCTASPSNMLESSGPRNLGGGTGDGVSGKASSQEKACGLPSVQVRIRLFRTMLSDPFSISELYLEIFTWQCANT